jgi:hypothetical protein
MGNRPVASGDPVATPADWRGWRAQSPIVLAPRRDFGIILAAGLMISL